MLKSENPLVGGTALRRAAIQSPGFQTGVTGWAINQDGSAEFNNVVIRNGQVVSGTAVYYSGAPAAGNLVASVSAAAGTDSKGNAYLAGIATYASLGGQVVATVLSPGAGNPGVFFYSAATEAGPYSTIAHITPDLLGQLTVSGNLTVLGSIINGLTVTGGLTADKETISSGQATGPMLDITNTTAAPTAPNLRVTLQAAGDPAIGFRVTGDTSSRFLADVTAGGLARIRTGPGNAALDTSLVRAAAAQWFADPVAFNNGGAAEVPLTVGGTGAAFANSWANAAAPGTPLQYARNAAPFHTMSWVGRIVAPVGIVAGQTITAAVAAAYRPAHTQKVAAINVTTGGAVRLSFGSAGTLAFQAGAVAGDSIDLGDLIYLDA